MAHYLIRYEYETQDSEKPIPAVYDIVEGKTVQDAIALSAVDDGMIVDAWTLRSAGPRRFKVVTETQTRIVAL